MIYLAVLISIFLNSTLFSTPFFIPIILSYFIFSKNQNAFLLAFIVGIVIDIFLINPIGLTSLYFSTAIFLVFLYSAKFEIETLPFTSIFTFLASTIYLFLFSSNFLIAKAAVCTGLAIIIYYFV